MKILRKLQPVLRLAILGTVTLGLSACASAPAWQQPYTLNRPAPTTVATVARAGVLRLEAVTAPSWLGDEQLLYRLQYANPLAVRPYDNARWAAAPGQMLAMLLSERLRQQGTWRAVLGPSQAGRPALLLQLGLHDFVVDYSSTSAGKAQISCTATLLEAKSYTVLAQRNFASDAPLQRVGPEGGAAAMNVAAQRLVGEIAAWAAQHSPSDAS